MTNLTNFNARTRNNTHIPGEFIRAYCVSFLLYSLYHSFCTLIIVYRGYARDIRYCRFRIASWCDVESIIRSVFSVMVAVIRINPICSLSHEIRESRTRPTKVFEYTVWSQGNSSNSKILIMTKRLYVQRIMSYMSSKNLFVDEKSFWNQPIKFQHVFIF